MMGARSPQDTLFAADHVFLDYVGRDTLYGYLAQHRQQLFRDQDFAALYCPNNGRPSVPPSLAVSILFLATSSHRRHTRLGLQACAHGGADLVAQGDGPGALAAYRAGLAIREALAARDPANT